MKNKVMRMDFTEALYDSDGKIIEGTEEELCILYNESVITSEEVKELINSGNYDYDTRVVVTAVERADNLRGE